MKDIKEKVRDQSPKIRNPASRLPKELVRSAMLETKEKTSIMADKIGRETGEESPADRNIRYRYRILCRAHDRSSRIYLLRRGPVRPQRRPRTYVHYTAQGIC